ncbi:MAG: NUDIX domain-containing protein [Rhodobacteraceae bacterium]|nr:MAG: NUDIX domain-containing protein [Paracoccaceae bacterium]
MIRRVGNAPEPGRAYRLRAGVYAILPLGDQVLLTRKAGSTEPLQLPGGGIDPGESPLQALHREVFEETGWRIADPRRIGAARRFVFMPDYGIWAEKLCTVFLAHPVRSLDTPGEAGHEVEFVPVAEVEGRLDNPVDPYLFRRAMRLGLVR